MSLLAFHFTDEVRLGDVIAGCSFLIAAIALFLNWWQLRLGGIRKRAEFIVSVFNQFVTDSLASDIFYEIEYGRFQYNEDFHRSDNERKLDRLLSYFEKIAALYEIGTITLHDLELVRYDFLRVYQDASVQKYFKTLDRLPSLLGVEGGTYSRYRRVAALLEKKRPITCEKNRNVSKASAKDN